LRNGNTFVCFFFKGNKYHFHELQNNNSQEGTGGEISELKVNDREGLDRNRMPSLTGIVYNLLLLAG